ncbi:MAG: hypothetical protein Q8Q39_05360 [bacterium]|nr:hypothetical protein [bacterium]
MAGIIALYADERYDIARRIRMLEMQNAALNQFAQQAPFQYHWESAAILYETGSAADSPSPYFWLNSGGLFFLEGGVGRTLQGALPKQSQWRLRYASANPQDSIDGYYPQNIFRLLTKNVWLDVEHEAYFRIRAHNSGDSPNENASNGVFLMSRYRGDGQSAYLAGMRVDGALVIKRKSDGAYATLAYQPHFGASPDAYRPHESLLPRDVWIGLRMVTVDEADGVSISLFIDEGRSRAWKKALGVIDAESDAMASDLHDPGHVGIRSDFMDIEIADWRLDAIR